MRMLWKIKFISDLMQVWKETKVDKKVLCIEEQDENAQYPNTLAFDFTKDKVELLDWLKEWDIVEVMYNCNYNKYPNPKNPDEISIFNSIRWWKVNMMKSLWQQAEDKKEKEENDDLPF
jgi:hypothetical protein